VGGLTLAYNSFIHETITINKIMINKIIEIALSGFWPFVGIVILLNGAAYFTINGLIKIWSRFMRMLMVRKHGWPPNHLDADGDWKPEQKSKGENNN
jgi:nucleoside recognition membrane protein YjiH